MEKTILIILGCLISLPFLKLLITWLFSINKILSKLDKIDKYIINGVGETNETVKK